MLKDDGSTLCLKTSSSWTRVCDTCRSAPCTIYCRPDSAYLCTACDARIHAAGKLAFSHERVWVCESCEQAPAAFICKADAASLCVRCDADIHSANPLARRHHRVPVTPIPGPLYGPQATEPRTMIGLGIESQSEGLSPNRDEDEDEAASWLLFDGPIRNNHEEREENEEERHSHGENGNLGGNEKGFLFNGEGPGGVDEYLDLVEFGGPGDQEQQQVYGDADRMVPAVKNDDHHRSFEAPAVEYHEAANGAGYGFHTNSLSHSISMSSLEVGVVPDSVSNLHQRPLKGTIDLFSTPAVQIPTQLTPMDREARVLRYREKKKTRKFEKTIRYASRKAYAETRPRVKGRFAKRTNVDVEVDQMFSIRDNAYGIVPSF